MAQPKHPRVRIMNTAIEILKRRTNGRPNTMAMDRIYRQKYSPLSDDPENNAAFLPAIMVYVNHEDNERIDWTEDRRTALLTLECYAVVDDDIEDALDVLTEQAAVALGRDQDLNGEVEWIHYKSSDWLYSKESDSDIEGARVTYEVRYISDSTSTLPLDDFETVDITTNVGTGDALSQIIEVAT